MRNCLILKVRAHTTAAAAFNLCRLSRRLPLHQHLSLFLPPCIPLQSTVVMQVNQSIIRARGLIFNIDGRPPTRSLAHTQHPFCISAHGLLVPQEQKKPRAAQSVPAANNIRAWAVLYSRTNRRPVLLLLSHYAWVGAKLKGLYHPCSSTLYSSKRVQELPHMTRKIINTVLKPVRNLSLSVTNLKKFVLNF
jgi:hypothetical protein